MSRFLELIRQYKHNSVFFKKLYQYQFSAVYNAIL